MSNVNRRDYTEKARTDRAFQDWIMACMGWSRATLFRHLNAGLRIKVGPRTSVKPVSVARHRFRQPK